MSDTSVPNGHPFPSAEELAAITVLALAMGRGSVKLCDALSSAYGADNQRSVRAEQIDQQLQPLVADLEQDSKPRI
jgi:hypothetical protein